MTKKCNDCGFELDKDTMFSKKSAGRCIPCYKLVRAKKYLDNIEVLRERGRNNYHNMSSEQKELTKIKKKEYNKNNKEHILDKNRNWYHENKDRLKKEGKCWYVNNKDQVKEKRKLRYSTPEAKLKRRKYQQNYYQKNKDRIKLKDREWESIPKNKIARRLRARIRASLNGRIKKVDFTEKLLGIKFEDLKIHLEQMFLPGMSWDNYGKWHLDHIIPCNYFNLEDESHQRICFNYRNLQPLWEGDNISKLDNILIPNPEEFIEAIKAHI